MKSNADYSSRNVAPLMTFFSGIIGYAPTQMLFRYDNLTPSDPTDDIFVIHPHNIGDTEYQDPPLPTRKSNELKLYERRARKSTRLESWRQEQNVGIRYFQDR